MGWAKLQKNSSSQHDCGIGRPPPQPCTMHAAPCAISRVRFAGLRPPLTSLRRQHPWLLRASHLEIDSRRPYHSVPRRFLTHRHRGEFDSQAAGTTALLLQLVRYTPGLQLSSTENSARQMGPVAPQIVTVTTLGLARGHRRHDLVVHQPGRRAAHADVALEFHGRQPGLDVSGRYWL